MATKSATIPARSSGVAAAVAGSKWSTSGSGAGSAIPGYSGSAGQRWAAARVLSTSLVRLSASRRVVEAWATRPPSTTARSRTWASSLDTFWWMRLLANRVSALTPCPQVTSASAAVAHEVEHPIADLLASPDLGVGRRVPGHQRTPTRTSVKRAGTEGWPVWPTCIGWPFPQLAVPQNTHSSGPPIMSIEAQNRGPMPV